MDEIVSERLLKRRESNKRHYEKNRDRYLAKMKAYIKKIAEHKREYDRQYRERNAEKYRENAKRYQKENPEVRRKLYRERRARLLNVEGDHFTEKEWQDLLNRTGHKCLCCGAKDKPLVRDHVIPLGPPHSDEISNIQPLCRTCNSKKRTKTTDYRR